MRLRWIKTELGHGADELEFINKCFLYMNTDFH